MRKIFYVLSVVWLLSGCMPPVSLAIDRAAVDRIVQGQTTKAEMLRIFGPPFSQQFNYDGKLQLMWLHNEYVGIGKIGMQNLVVLFDREDRVEKYNFTAPP